MRSVGSLSHEGSMQMVCIVHAGAAQGNNPGRRKGPLGLGFPGKAACMARECVGHPQSRWR